MTTTTGAVTVPCGPLTVAVAEYVSAVACARSVEFTTATPISATTPARMNDRKFRFISTPPCLRLKMIEPLLLALLFATHLLPHEPIFHLPALGLQIL